MSSQKYLIKFSPLFLTLLLTGLSLGTSVKVAQAKPPEHAPAWGYRCRQGDSRACERLNQDRDDDEWENREWEDNDDREERNYRSFGRLEAGTIFDVEYRGRRSLIFRQDERYGLTLYLDENLRGNANRVLIPEGSKIEGEFRPAGEGVRFFARRVELPNGQRYRLEATSRVIYSDRRVTQRDSQDLITDAARVILEEILGNNRGDDDYDAELIVLNSGRNLELELQRDFRLND